MSTVEIGEPNSTPPLDHADNALSSTAMRDGEVARAGMPEESRVAEFCRRWRILDLSVFGSALRNDFGPDSDIDLLVTFAADAHWSLLDHVRMEAELNALFHREVDLVSRRAIERSENWMRRQEILGTARPLYVA
jgi:uncharacterized protein